MKQGIVFCMVWLMVLVCSAQQRCDFYFSTSGSDRNPGNNINLPKRSIDSSAADLLRMANLNGQVNVGFKGGDHFKECFTPTSSIRVGSYFAPGAPKTFAVFNGADAFDSGWMRTNGTANVYEHWIPLTGFTGSGINNIGQYSMVYVFEIDRLLEHSFPISAKRLLSLRGNLAEADLQRASFYEAVTTNANPLKVYIHTSDGSSPNHNPRYRYEVTVRDRAFNSTDFDGNVFDHLWVTGYGGGNGMLPSGANSRFNRVIFGPGAGIHHLVTKNGLIENSLFLPSAKNTNEYAVVFYDEDGRRRGNTIKNSIFLDIKYPVYTHTNATGQQYGSLELNNVIAFADSSHVESFLETADTDSVIMKDVYTDQYKWVYNFGKATNLFVKNCTFLHTRHCFRLSDAAQTISINNSFIGIDGTKAAGLGVLIGYNSRIILANSIFHIKGGIGAGAGAVQSFTTGSNVQNYSDVSANVFIADVDTSQTVRVACTSLVTTIHGMLSKDSWKNNVYILLKGKNLTWRLYYPNQRFTDIHSFDEWKRRTGLDTGSLFFDLRNDPRGLKAIFVDPDRGDYALANTPEANQIRQLKAGMVNPISCFLTKPSYEAAANIIMNNWELTGAACRNPCVQNNIRINYQFSNTVAGKSVQLKWNIDEDRNVDYYEVLRSFGTNDFVSIGLVDASGQSQYTFTDSTVLPGIEYRYTLALVSKMGDRCYAAVRSAKIDNGKPIVIYPNPSSGIIRFSLNDYTGPVKISILNAMGVVVATRSLVSTYGIHPSIDLSNLPKGYYWMKASTDQNSSLQGFMLK